MGWGSSSVADGESRNRGVAAIARIAGASLLAVAVSSCGMGSFLGGGGETPAAGNRLANTNASAEEIALNAQSALPAIATECPPIKVRNGGEALFSYQNNKVGDPRALSFQAVIDRQSRNCVVSNGLITVKMGVTGRVLLGPTGNQQSVTLPIRFAVERDDLAVFSQKYDVPVQITPPGQSADFVQVVENVAIPYVGGEEIVIWVGFDSAQR